MILYIDSESYLIGVVVVGITGEALTTKQVGALAQSEAQWNENVGSVASISAKPRYAKMTFHNKN